MPCITLYTIVLLWLPCVDQSVVGCGALPSLRLADGTAFFIPPQLVPPGAEQHHRERGALPKTKDIDEQAESASDTPNNNNLKDGAAGDEGQGDERRPAGDDTERADAAGEADDTAEENRALPLVERRGKADEGAPGCGV